MAKSRWRFQKETRATKITGSKRYEKQKYNCLKNQTVIELAGIATFRIPYSIFRHGSFHQGTKATLPGAWRPFPVSAFGAIGSIA
jgi:hypothetical protein